MVASIKVTTFKELLGSCELKIFSIIYYCVIHGTEICIFIRRSFLNRFSVAIKSTKSIGTENNPILKLQPPNGSETETKGADVMSDPDLDLLIDEAKTMYTIDGYHENIVNLQGIVYDVDIGNSRLGRVSIINDKESTKHYKPYYDFIWLMLLLFF